MMRETLAQTFLSAGEDYERFRPGFPREAAEEILPEQVASVLDLGAGTGKFTGLLLDRADAVLAVDPSSAMLEQLRRRYPDVEALVGTAESIPVPAESQGAVTVAQAFHWFDEAAACREISRVLTDGGMLGLIWNGPDPTCLWDLAAHEIAHPGTTAQVGRAETAFRPQDLPGFETVRGIRIPWTEQISRADYLRRWQTVSTFLAAESADRGGDDGTHRGHSRR
ncbi:class I SAM-dependent methyltransferase [Zhihengliuella sp.]|uniref:class I SAM-dependent methyltransferase n=1 Tax=Zhihengliuella sp. TaxID=1954483 RepID=UPI0028112BF7|nr:class I SAM-dependent methyltransferase [Zhihengliuella sp.]